MSHDCEPHLYAIDDLNLYACSVCGSKWEKMVEGYRKLTEQMLTERAKVLDSLGLSGAGS